MANGLFGGGNGSTSTPYLVEDAADLNAVRNSTQLHYKQVADVDLSGFAEWVPMPSLAGSYDGGNYTISNLRIRFIAGISAYGLFSTLSGSATVGNLKFSNVDIELLQSDNLYAGTLCANNNSTGEIKNVHVLSGRVICRYVGGVACYCGNAIFRDCSNAANVSSTYTSDGSVIIGGICGSLSTPLNGNFYNCVNTGDIGPLSTDTLTGSFIASGISNGNCYDCSNSGNITSYSSVACGISYNPSNVHRCHNSGNITSYRSEACGISRGGGPIDCYNNGTITTGSTGVGMNSAGGAPQRCYNSGNMVALRSGCRIYGITSVNAANCFYLGSELRGKLDTIVYKISPSTNNSNCYSLDTSQVILEA